MAEQKQLPTAISRVHTKFSTPYIAILITAVVMLVLTLKSSFVAALTISAIARLVTYAATCVALIVLRRDKSSPEARFHLPGGILISILSLLLIVWLVSNSTVQEAKVAAIAAAVGLLIHFSYKVYSRSS
jgi:amino acid transporter